jgi:hypothetical protein
MPTMDDTCYLNPHQARDGEPDAYQNLLGDVIERSFAAGVHDLAGLVTRLNEARVPAPDGDAWTDDLFRREMKRLGA